MTKLVRTLKIKKKTRVSNESKIWGLIAELIRFASFFIRHFIFEKLRNHFFKEFASSQMYEIKAIILQNKKNIRQKNV